MSNLHSLRAIAHGRNAKHHFLLSRTRNTHGGSNLIAQDRRDSNDSDTEDEQGLDEGDEAQLFQQRKDSVAVSAEPGTGDDSPPPPSDERHKIAAQVMHA